MMSNIHQPTRGNVMRKFFEWFDSLTPNHMLWAVTVYTLAMITIVVFIHYLTHGDVHFSLNI